MTNCHNLIIDKDSLQYRNSSISGDVFAFNNYTELSQINMEIACCSIVICYCEQGWAEFTLRGDSLIIEEGQMLFITSQGHLTGRRWSLNLKLQMAQFSPTIANLIHKERIVALQFGFMDPIVHLGPEEQKILEDTKLLMKDVLFYSNFRQTCEMAASILEILLFLFSPQFQSKGDYSKAHSRAGIVVETFLKDLRSNYYKSRAVNFYAKRQYISVNYLNKCCKAVTGRSAQKCINKYILQHARRLLKDNNLLVKEVAAAIGFPNLTSFSKFFRKETGHSPSDFMKENSGIN